MALASLASSCCCNRCHTASTSSPADMAPLLPLLSSLVVVAWSNRLPSSTVACHWDEARKESSKAADLVAARARTYVSKEGGWMDEEDLGNT